MKNKKWKKPIIKHNKLTKYHYLVHYPEKLKMGSNFDIGAFCYINCSGGVRIEDNVQVGSHCSIYSSSTIDGKIAPVVLKRNCKVGTHSTIMPNVTIGENSIVAAHSFVKKNVPKNELWAGIPAKFMKKLESK